MASPPAPGPLAGLRVVDCSTVLAGPYCTMLLGDLGADVVKVEPPEGDATRGWGPPWVGPAATRASPGPRPTTSRSIGTSAASGSTSSSPTASPSCAGLLERGDVLVENFRVGGFARLGFDDEALRRLNPGLVHLAISGYGPAGPAADRPGYDFVIQAASGLMSITGASDEDGGEPTKVGVAISDVVSGMLGAVARPGRAGRARADRVRRSPARASGSTSRCSDRPSPASSTRRRTRSSAASRPGGSATPIRTSSRTRRSRPPTARSRSPSARSGSGPGCARRSVLPALAARSALCDERRPGRGAGDAPPDPGRALRRRARPRTGSPRSTRPTSRAGRSTTSSRRSPRRRRRRSG